MIQPTKLITIVGARPQFIKAFALSRALAEAVDFDEILVHTGQHFDANMSTVFFDELGIRRPKYHFDVQTSEPGAAVAQMLSAIEGALQTEQPDAVIVYGDTNSTLAGALAAAQARIPLVHVEAGMRSFNRRMLEEINRVATDHLSDMHLCVTHTAAENLAREGIVQNVRVVGDLMQDATRLATETAERTSTILERLSLQARAYGVATVHRAGNTDDLDMLARLFDFIAAEAQRQPIVFPIHPRTARAAAEFGLNPHRPGIIVIEPVGYLDMCHLLHHATIVLTDSGGLQKEAYFHRVPCVTLRGETEWVETIACGWNRLWTVPEYRERREIADFGQGDAAAKIVQCLRDGLRAPAN
jgi:UDP-GlcNAc3NAcA epimerase